jgi:hypothetical protein
LTRRSGWHRILFLVRQDGREERPHDLLTLLDDVVEEAAEDGDAVTVTDLGQAGMVGQRLMQIIPEIPAQAEPISGDAQ